MLFIVVYLYRYNQLSSIPASLANCTKIDEFNIEGNNVSELPVSAVFFSGFSFASAKVVPYY